MMRTVVALAVTALAAASVGTASARPGNGAQKSGLATATGLAPLACEAADPATAGRQTSHGFVLLNAPGRPAKEGRNARAGAPARLIGQIALRGAAPGSYDVRLAPGSGCGETLGTMTVDQGGTGSFHFSRSDKGAGTWHVLLTQRPVAPLPLELQQYASAPVTVR